MEKDLPSTSSEDSSSDDASSHDASSDDASQQDSISLSGLGTFAESVAGSSEVTTVAVVDIGTTSIRLAIAEISAEGAVTSLDQLAQAVHLGKDTFTRGRIQKKTIENCVRILKSYRHILNEYGVTRSENIRVVATSAVREARNRLAFLDRIFSATGFLVEPLDEAEVNRITYLSIQPILKMDQQFSELPVVITEVGGGSTEVLIVQGTDVVYAQSYRLGSIRLQEQLGQYHVPQMNQYSFMENQIERTVGEVIGNVPDGPVQLIALGGDIRFAASQLIPDWVPGTLGRLSVKKLRHLTEKILGLSVDELVRKYRLTYPDAETLGPTLLADLKFAQALKLDDVFISDVNLRSGLLQEFSGHGLWTEEFIVQMTRSAIALGQKFSVDESHALHVAKLCRVLFRELQSEHGLSSQFEGILFVAALLHEVGQFVGTAAFHKHSMYIIRNSELFGLGKANLLLIALVARYHRRASPASNHEGYNSLDREQRIAVSKLAAILRVADALDYSHSQRVQEIRCSQEESRFVIAAPAVDDLSLEQLALRQKGGLFDEIFGMQVLLRTVR